ncbi:MAG TPA: serine/threonine-protein kinase [Myxococcales bacterium]|nr:serine/threonine-protein kinase [Myxococcales bacterium]
MPENTLPPDVTDPGYATPASLDVTAEPSVTTASLARPIKPLERGEPLGRYIILRTLGEGGMGIVYSAYDPELDRRVAIKLLRPSGTASPERQMRLMREAQALARIAHPNVIAVYDVGTHNENVFVAMELVESGTLTDWLEEKKRTPREIIVKFLDAGKGLGAAHAAGMIHRDFKPENVLVGKDGRCHVTDFGLARLTTSGEHQPIGEADQQPTDTGKVINQRLTRAGAVVGTPLFMSWEQFQGRPADQRSDQYNFCASLYWALFGTPPPGPYTASDSRESTAEAAVSGASAYTPQRLRDLPKEPRLPAPVRRAILRGLSLKPEDRYPTMEELLRELGKDPRAAQRRWVIAGVGTAAVAAAAMTYWPILQQHRQLCRGAERKLEGVWTPSIRDQVEQAFAATGSRFGEESAKRASVLLDKYTAAWVAMHQEACEATRIRGEQSDQVLALRMICLDRRLQQVGALSKLFAAPDAKMVEKALDAASALPPIDNCADIAALTSPVPRPDDPAEQAYLEREERSVAEARALQDAARYKQALEVTRTALAESEKHLWPPLRAELLHIQGWASFRTGDPAAAERILREALLWSERGRHESEKMRILTKLAYVVAQRDPGRFDEALYWGRLGESVGARLTDVQASVELGLRLGLLYVTKGDYEQGRATLERAAVLCDRSLGRDIPTMGTVLAALADAYARTGDYQRALELLKTSLEIAERTRGPSHPNVGYIHRTLAFVLYRLGNYSPALEHIKATIRLWTDAYGPEHPEVADALDYMATILHLDGEDGEALMEANKALAIKIKALGRDNVNCSYSLGNIGQALLGLRRFPEALTYLERAESMQEAAKLSPEEIAEVRFGYARALWETKKDRSRALVLATQARDGFHRGHDRRSEEEADHWLEAHGGGRAALARP